ncbi:hypothetical protein ABE527_15315 [Brucella sp. TWI432]
MHTDKPIIDRILSLGSKCLSDYASRQLLRIAGILSVIIAMAVVVIYSVEKPDNNWDMIPYVATALEDRYPDATALHAETWRQIEAAASSDQLSQLRSSDGWRRAQWENPEFFKSQLVMYRVKAGYVQLLRWIEPFTGLVRGGHLISLAAALALGFVILLMLWRYNAFEAGLFIGPALLIAGYGPMSAAVFPDVVMAAISLAAIFAFMRERDWVAAILLLLSFTIRPDNIIMIFALLIASVMFGWRKLPLLVAFVASAVAGAMISHAAEHPGWWAHLYFSCIEQQKNMVGFHPDFSPLLLVKAYIRGVIFALYSETWLAMLVVMLVAWAATYKAEVRAAFPRFHGILFAMTIGVLGKFVYFPLPDDRFYFNMIIVIAILLSMKFTAHLKNGAFPIIQSK